MTDRPDILIKDAADYLADEIGLVSKDSETHQLWARLTAYLETPPPGDGCGCVIVQGTFGVFHPVIDRTACRYAEVLAVAKEQGEAIVTHAKSEVRLNNLLFQERERVRVLEGDNYRIGQRNLTFIYNESKQAGRVRVLEALLKEFRQFTQDIVDEEITLTYTSIGNDLLLRSKQALAQGAQDD